MLARVPQLRSHVELLSFHSLFIAFSTCKYWKRLKLLIGEHLNQVLKVNNGDVAFGMRIKVTPALNERNGVSFGEWLVTCSWLVDERVHDDCNEQTQEDLTYQCDEDYEESDRRKVVSAGVCHRSRWIQVAKTLVGFTLEKDAFRAAYVEHDVGPRLSRRTPEQKEVRVEEGREVVVVVDRILVGDIRKAEKSGSNHSEYEDYK